MRTESGLRRGCSVLFVTSMTALFQSLLTFIQPFHWWLPYVPVLSEQLLELLEAPGTFIMGCHSSHKHQIQGVCTTLARPVASRIIAFVL